MKVLSIQQPWATVIALGLKDIENRTWATDFRGQFLIHATRWKSERDFHAGVFYIEERIGRDGLQQICGTVEWPKHPFEAMRTFGAIIGEATLQACVRQSRSEWFEGPVGFVLAGARTVRPIEIKGRLGFWDYSGPVERLS